MEETQRGVQEAAPGEAAKAVAYQVHDEGHRLADTARNDALQAAEQRKSAATAYLSDLASAVHRGWDGLRQKGHESSAALVDIAASSASWWW